MLRLMSFILQKDKAVTVKSIVIINFAINFSYFFCLTLYEFYYFCMFLGLGIVDTIAVTSTYHLIQMQYLINALKIATVKILGSSRTPHMGESVLIEIATKFGSRKNISC